MPLYRTKGIVNFYNIPEKTIFQSVNNQSVTQSAGAWGEGEEQLSKIVFIGKNIDKDIIERELKFCCYDEASVSQEFYQQLFELMDESESILKLLAG